MERLGPYRLEQTINVGSIGEVFLAYRDGDPPGHAVVVKRLHRELARRPEHVALFVQEGVMARRLEHRNLVRALCAGEVAREAEGAPPDHYIAMDLVRGPNLAQLAERGPVPAAAALRIAVDLCAGLAYMHDSGIVHCDVSPTNVLIGPDRALLTDFGVTCPV
ncbi:MAG TPA: protein kinase, partial [Kofleriaceae bacterium]|nr:protein kinase [Kofleriaceae bacterium]